MANLDMLSLLDILPDRVTDKEMEALAYAIDPEMQKITKAAQEVVIMPRIKDMPEDIVDLLAWQLHVDFYEPLGLDLDKKRALVESSIRWHMHKGTPAVVEEIMRLLFFPNFWVEEWFEYDGRPYFFRAIALSEPMTREGLGEAMKAINTTKNTRSWLDYILFRYEQHNTTYHATALTETRKEFIIVDQQTMSADVATYHTVASNLHVKEFIAEQNPIPNIISDHVAVTKTEIRKEVHE